MGEIIKVDLSERLHHSIVRELFLSITDQDVQDRVAVKPPGNALFVYSGDLAANTPNGSTAKGRKKAKIGNWKSDNYQFGPLGTEALPKTRPLFVRRAFAARVAHYSGKNVATTKAFRRDVFHIHDDCDDADLLAFKGFCIVHYYGDSQATVDLPHGNSPRSGKAFHSTMASVRQRAIELDGTPTEIVTTLRQEATGDNELPRNTAMVKYAKAAAGKAAALAAENDEEHDDENDDDDDDIYDALGPTSDDGDDSGLKKRDSLSAAT